MMTASWTATGDYFARYLLGLPEAGATVPNSIAPFATRLLRARGPLPAFRVGEIPYGILPITPLPSMINARIDSITPAVARYVQTARPMWDNIVRTFPLQVTQTQGASPEQALMNVLARDASTVRISGQLDTGPWFAWNLAQWDLIAASQLAVTDPGQSTVDKATASAITANIERARAMVRVQARALGWPTPGRDTPLGGMLYLNPLGLDLPHVVADGQVSDSRYLAPSYVLRRGVRLLHLNVLQYILALSVSQLLEFMPAKGDLTVLTALIRQSLLLEYAKAAGQVLGVTLKESEAQGGSVDTPVWALVQTQFTPPSGLPAASGRLGDYIQLQVQTPAGQSAFASLYALRDAVAHLALLSTAALDRVLTESLDVCSYRLDAWATAVATDLLLTYRRKTGSGISLGVWSYIENLRPAPAQTLSATDVAALTAALGSAPAATPFAPAKDSTGYVFAPSLAHAATGAVLRNGYLSHAAGNVTPAFAIDLSSKRVRHALYIMEGMRQGQPLGALLGYLFEQGLNDAGLQVLVQPFRNAYPIVANKMTQYESAAADAVAASNVVDGAALQTAWEAKEIHWGTGDLPPAETSNSNYLTATGLLDMLSDRVDALNDIAISESVYQVALGNPTRAGGALNASSREQHPPEPQVLETPRTGLDFTQRLLSCFAVDPKATPSPSAWLGTQSPTARASAEPWLERWLSAILPAPGNVVFQVTYTDNAGSTITSATVTLATMGLAALDLVALAPPPPTADAATTLDGSELIGSDLERWLIWQCSAMGVIPVSASTPKLLYVPAGPLNAPSITLPQLLTLVRSVQELLGTAQPITPADFLPPATQFPLVDLDFSGVAQRLAKALTDLTTLNTTLASKVAALQPATLTSADGNALSQLLMTAAAFGFPGAAPVTLDRNTASLSALLAQAVTVSANVAQRLKTLTSNRSLYSGGALVLSALAPSPMAAQPAPLRQVLDVAKSTAQAIFGLTFLVLPVVTPSVGGSSPDPVEVALTNVATVAAAGNPSDPLTVASVIQQLTHVRPPVMRLDEVMSLSSVLTGTPAPNLIVAQLGGSAPFSASNPWLGAGPFDPAWAQGLPPRNLAGTFALLLWAPPSLGAITGASITGLRFDSWTERIPSSVEKPAVAFHYAEPSARAPQSLLLAVAPPDEDNWNAQLMLATVLEAVSWAKIRTVDPQTLESRGQVGQFLPALFATFGASTLSSLLPTIPTAKPWPAA